MRVFGISRHQPKIVAVPGSGAEAWDQFRGTVNLHKVWTFVQNRPVSFCNPGRQERALTCPQARLQAHDHIKKTHKGRQVKHTPNMCVTGGMNFLVLIHGTTILISQDMGDRMVITHTLLA